MAKSVKALITPEVLKWARERRIRLEVDYAAKRLKIEPEDLEAWENGTEQPTIAQLKKIAKLYKTHISIFYFSEPPTELQPLTDYRVLPEQFAIDTEQVYRLNANIIEAFERREVLIELYELLEEVPLERITKEITIEHILVVLKTKFPTELVDALVPALQKIDDLERLKDLYRQTIHARSIHAFAQKLID